MATNERRAGEIVINKGDFDRDRESYILQASASQRVVVRHESTNEVSAVFGGSLNVAPDLDIAELRGDVESPDEVVTDIFGAWLNAPRLHGCTFATWAAKNDRIRYAAFFDPPSADLVAQLERQTC